MLATLLLKRKLQHEGHMQGHMQVTSGLFSGSNGSTGATHFQPCCSLLQQKLRTALSVINSYPIFIRNQQNIASYTIAT